MNSTFIVGIPVVVIGLALAIVTYIPMFLLLGAIFFLAKKEDSKAADWVTHTVSVIVAIGVGVVSMLFWTPHLLQDINSSTVQTEAGNNTQPLSKAYQSLRKTDLSKSDVESFKRNQKVYDASVRLFVEESKYASKDLASGRSTSLNGEQLLAGKSEDLTAPVTATGWNAPVFRYDGATNATVEALVPVYNASNGGTIKFETGTLKMDLGLNGEMKVTEDSLSSLIADE